MRLTMALLFVIGAAAGEPRVVAAQGELVIVKEGTKQYHRPGCPVIRDAKDVLAMTRAQAESRGLTSHADCEGETSAGAGRGAQEKPAPRIYVFTDSGKYYHRQDCRKIEGTPTKVLLDEAGKKKWPCPVCRPPVRKKSSEPAVRIRR